MKMSKKNKIKMGCKARDIVTGFEGIVTSKTSYITGCSQYYLVSQSEDASKKAEGTWVDEPRLKVIDSKKVKLKFDKGVSKKRHYGGPTPNKGDTRSV